MPKIITEEFVMNYNKKSIVDIDVAGKRVLCRCDFNEIGRASCRERV